METRKQYRNMRDGIAKEPRAVKYAEEATRRAGLEPKFKIIRGGTDGAQLTEKGLPTPNLSTGEHNPHSPLEWTCLEEMEAAVRVVIELCQVWAGKKQWDADEADFNADMRGSNPFFLILLIRVFSASSASHLLLYRITPNCFPTSLNAAMARSSLLVRVGGGHLDADAGLALRHHRVAEADHVDARASAARRPSSWPPPRRRASPAGSASARA